MVVAFMSRKFALTYDYRCPFGRIMHDHVVTGLHAGADWDVTFLPFCLGQTHVEAGMPDVWDAPATDTGIDALQFSVSLRDLQPEAFLNFHHQLYEHRHTAGGSLRDRQILKSFISEVGGDASAATDDVESGRPLKVIKTEHTAYAESHGVWGVPTFVVGDAAVFVRLMKPSFGDAAVATSTIDRILDYVDWPEMNEFKHTRIPN